MSLWYRLNYVLLLENSFANEKFNMEGIHGGKSGVFYANEMSRMNTTIQPN